MERLTFFENKIDSFSRMQLLDMARTLTDQPQLQIDFAYHAAYRPQTETIIVSYFWEDFPRQAQMAGMKSDVFLRAFGIKFSDATVIRAYSQAFQDHPLQQLALHLFSFGEDQRLEAICQRIRPGTSKDFQTRHRLYRRQMKNRLKGHRQKGNEGDLLFTMVYERLTSFALESDLPELPSAIMNVFQIIQPQLEMITSAQSTQDVADRCQWMMEAIEVHISKDMKSNYFAIDEGYGTEQPVDEETIDDLKRPGQIEIEDQEQLDEREEEVNEEKLPMWHQETGQGSDNFLQFDLERGTNTDMLGDQAREGDPGDEAMGMIQGSARMSRRQDFHEEEWEKRLNEWSSASHAASFGQINRHVTPRFLKAESAQEHDVDQYRALQAKIAQYQKNLQRTIYLTLEQRKTSPKEDLPFGRLSKKLTKMVTEDHPKLFYKKKNPDPQIDAAFMLLVDCSASMYDKMDYTKKGIVLFHETLRALQIPHAVTGFWEEAEQVKEDEVPNTFQNIIDFTDYQQSSSGPRIMQLEPQQDNRDGYAIRMMTRDLLTRPESQRIMLVFSDGEPAAANYVEEGVLDTYEAVLEARRQGIEVMSVFLANGEIAENTRQTFQNIYGRHSITVPKIEDLPAHLLPILRKILLNQIR